MVVKKLITPIIEVQEKLAQVKFDAFDFVIKDFEKSSAEAIDNLKKTVQESKDKYYSDLEKQKQLIEKFDSTPLEKVPEIIKELKENNIIELVDVVGFLNKINNIQINQPEVPIIVKEDTKKVGAETIIKDDSQVSGLEEKIDEKPETTKTPTYQDLITESLPGCKASYTSIKRIISNVISNEENSFHKELGDYLNDSSSGVLHRYIKACGYTSLSKIGVINEDIMKSVVRNYITDLKSVSKVMEYIIKRKESGKKPRIKQVQELINCDVKIAHQAVLAAVEVGITQYLNKIPNLDNKIKQDNNAIELNYNEDIDEWRTKIRRVSSSD